MSWVLDMDRMVTPDLSHVSDQVGFFLEHEIEDLILPDWHWLLSPLQEELESV